MTLDHEIASLVHHLGQAGTIGELLAQDDGADRLDAFCGGLLPYTAPQVQVLHKEALGPNGPVPLRIYGDTSRSGAPALVWMHGGNFAVGDLDMRESDQLGRELAARSGCIVLSVNYRLALDGVHFPVPHEDVLAAWFWTVEHAAEYGIDPTKICLGGASVGGNLAVGAALYLVDAGLQLPAQLVLAYPFLHGELPADDSRAIPRGDVPQVLWFGDEDCRNMVENYIGGPLTLATSYAMPGQADPTGLPPVAILGCEHDNLRFSAELFIEALDQAHIPVTYKIEEGAPHAYLNYSAALGIVQRGLQFISDQLVSLKAEQKVST